MLKISNCKRQKGPSILTPIFNSFPRISCSHHISDSLELSLKIHIFQSLCLSSSNVPLTWTTISHSLTFLKNYVRHFSYHTSISYLYLYINLPLHRGFPSGSDGIDSACNAGVQGLIPGSGRSPEGNGYPLQYICLENSMDRGT